MNNPCVVVIDDERDVLALICDVLEDEGYRAICLPDVERTPQLVQCEHTPALFLLDIMLPRTTGIEVARGLRATGFGQTPMIAMSASTAMLQAAVDSDLFQATIAKPFDLDTLLGTVEQYAA